MLFINQDVRDVDLSAGTVFFLNNPFAGSILEEVVEKVRQVATQHPIKILALWEVGRWKQCAWLTEEWSFEEGVFTTAAVFRSG
jgi:hypothetical protein